MLVAICAAAACGFAVMAGAGMAGAVATGGTGLGVLTARTTAAAAAPCAGVLFVGARGTGESGPGTPGWKDGVDYNGLGGVVHNVLTRVEHDVRGQRTLQVVRLDYQANSVWTLLSDHSKYFRGIDAGATTALSTLATQAQKCPYQQIVLAGYSQGAMVMHRVLLRLSDTHTPADAAILHRIAAAVLVGDGDQVPNDNQLRFGSASLAARGIGQAYRNISHTTTEKFTTSVGIRVLSVCNTHDIVCGWTDTNIVKCISTDVFCPASLDHMIAIHLHSYKGRKPLLQAADQASLNLLALKYTGSAMSLAGTAGSPLAATAKVTGGSLPLTVTAQGAVPAWVKVSDSVRTITISGTPTATGSWAFNLIVQDTKGGEATVPVQITVSGSGGGWGTAEEVPRLASLNVDGDTQLDSMSCVSAGNCSAGGWYADANNHEQAFVVSEVNGTWLGAIEVPGTGSLNAGGNAQVESVSCASPGNCSAAGNYVDANGDYDAFVVSEVNGTWQNAMEVPGPAAFGLAGVNTVSCASAGNCSAGGYYVDANGDYQALVVSEVNGTWQNATEVPGAGSLNAGGNAEVESVSCASAGNCSAGGYYADVGNDHQAFVVSEVNGTWQNATEVPGTESLNVGGNARVESVSCASPGNCSAAGNYVENANYLAVEDAFGVSEVNGTWQDATEVPGSAAGYINVNSMSCTSPGNCSAGGSYTDANVHFQAFVFSEVNGTWLGAIEVPGTASLNAGANAGVNSVSCTSPGNCSAGGSYTDANGDQWAFVASEVNGTWQNVTDVPGTAALGRDAGVNSVSCTSAGNCSAGGWYTDANGDTQAFVVSKS